MPDPDQDGDNREELDQLWCCHPPGGNGRSDGTKKGGEGGIAKQHRSEEPYADGDEAGLPGQSKDNAYGRRDTPLPP